PGDTVYFSKLNNMHESRRPFISRSLPGEHTSPKSLPASLPTTPVTFQIPTSSLTVPAAQQATGIEGKLIKPRNRRSLSTSSSQSLLKKSLSKPRALSNLYPSNLLSTIEGDANNRSSFEDFDFSTSGILPTGTNSGSNSSSSSSNSPYLTSFPFYQRERHHSLFVLSHPQQQQQQRPSISLQQQNLLNVPSTQSGTAVSSTSSQQKLPHQPIQSRQSGASSQLKRLLSLKSESYPSNTPSLYSDSETDSLETDSDAYVTNDEHVLSSSIKRKPSFQKYRFFPDLSIDAEQNRLSNLHIIDDGSPEFTFPKVKRKLLKDLEEAKSRADKRIMVILDNWYKSHQYQELLSEFLYDGWSDDDDIQHSPIKIQKKSSQKTLNKEKASPVISDTDDEASHLDKLSPEIKSMKKDVLAKDKITHKMESLSLYGNTRPKNILKKSKNFKRRLVHSNSWPSSIL
ncbi:12573_t:CDS:1, partial [Dentiscutata heterogama]